ncbi:MAG: ribokinase [Clostridia bacterium]|nr:ribokinase [Clostridia bacterium]
MSKIAVIGIIGNSVFLPVERFHEGGETVEASSVHFEPGGKGFNQAVAAARCGAEVYFLAAVGREYRRDFSEFLDNEKISHTLVFKEDSTAFAAIVTDKSGSNHVTVYQGTQLSPDDVLLFEEKIKNADILLLNNEVSEEVNIAAIKIAKEYGIKCILNPAPARVTDNFILDSVDLFTPNEHETLGLEDNKNVVVTLGKKGCLIKSTGELIPTVNSGKTVDTTGAGDTFNGVLCAMLANGNSIAKSARIANKAASVGVTRKYAVSSIPQNYEMKEIIECEANNK